ncbi:hypothetical protein [Psychroserpens algicola]|uniref:hypothetical protein n=1 Tax=Psychroserpens algicola TaxID=1719034 RepID=UPI001954E601|nr:hypothetical protein [Psychroserpens algicola]
MKKVLLVLCLVGFASQICKSQEWLTSLDAAQRLALIQDKMVLMVWEEATTYPYPVLVEDASGRKVLVENLFEADYLNTWIWNHFVPVIVSESDYAKLFEDIDGKRKATYINKFNDDSIKIMDINGNIVNTKPVYDEFLNLSAHIRKYYINTAFLKGELLNYFNDKNFNTSFYLASKYIDAAIYLNKDVRSEVIELSSLYLQEANQFLSAENLDNKNGLAQKLELLSIYQDLVLNRPRKVLRQLNRIEPTEIDQSNEAMVAFLYLTAHRDLKDEKSASIWRSKVSLLNLKKAKDIITN